MNIIIAISLDFFFCFFFFFNDTATTEIYTLSLHDALPIRRARAANFSRTIPASSGWSPPAPNTADRKSTRLNSSHRTISYAVFCLKKKKTHNKSIKNKKKKKQKKL